MTPTFDWRQYARQLMPGQDDLVRQVQEGKATGGTPVRLSLYMLTGIFGELENCNAVGEAIIEPPEELGGGTFLKIFGCNVIYKGNPSQDKVYSLELAKSNIMVVPSAIIARSFLLSMACLTLFVFARRSAMSALHYYMEAIMHKCLRYLGRPEVRYNSPSKELVRAMNAALAQEFWLKDGERLATINEPSGTLYPHTVQYQDKELAAVIAKVNLFLATVIEWDCAYRFPLQDMFAELDKEKAKKNGAKEFLRLVDIYCARGVGLGNRITFIRMVLRFGLRLMPRLRRIIHRFMNEIDKGKMALDDDDYYFCLRRISYNFRGKTLAERLAELPEADRKYGNQYVRIEYRPPVATGTPTT